jgi:leucyl aminopeptidase (aminopeptidase T)
VFDGAIGGHGLLDEPVRVTVAGGRLVAAEGGAAARWLVKTLDAGGEHGRSIAELGIGTNPAARLIGSIIEDEKVKGTAHIAFGTSAGIGGVNVASVHIDGMVLDPALEFGR